MLSDDLDHVMYAAGAFGAQKITFSGAEAWGYFDQEENLGTASGDNILVKRTVFVMRAPKTGSTMAGLTQDSAVTINDPETDISTDFVVSDKELIGDGREWRLILRPETS